MAISRQKKGEILTKLTKIVKNSATIVLVNFHGLTMLEATSVRKDLKSRGAGFTVAKKTLTKKVLSEAGFKGQIPELPGELGMVYLSDSVVQAGEVDLIEGARGVYEFQKKLNKKIQIVGGVFQGKFMNQSEMTAIAQIPTLKTLQAQFVNLISSPIQGFVLALNQIAEIKNKRPVVT